MSTLELPSVALDRHQQGIVEALRDGWLHPLTGFPCTRELESITQRQALLDGTAWPFAIALVVKESPPATELLLRDHEGRAIARMSVREQAAQHDGVHLCGEVGAVDPIQSVRAKFQGTLAFAYDLCLHRSQVDALARHALQATKPLLLLRHGIERQTPEVTAELTDWAHELALAHLSALGVSFDLIEMPDWRLPPDDAAWVDARVARNLGASQLLIAPAHASLSTEDGLPVVHDADLEGVHAQVLQHLGTGNVDAARALSWANVTSVLARQPVLTGPTGFTVLMTGLSGSGKSTIAQLLCKKIMRASARPVTLLDGDLVRQHLSSGLGFDAAARQTNLLRIAFVGAEINRHGGIVICAPIAPYAAVRRQMRERISACGRFVEVHISTPLEVCEQRDPKGWYARARAGRMPGFTGIDDPYETPNHPELRIDTSDVTADACAEQILRWLVDNSLFKSAS